METGPFGNLIHFCVLAYELHGIETKWMRSQSRVASSSSVKMDWVHIERV